MKRLMIVSVVMGLPVIASAAAEDRWQFGVGAGGGLYTVSDPDGEAGNTFAAPFGVLATVQTARNWRLWLEGSYVDFDLDASTTEIGQSITAIGTVASLQRRFSTSESFRPWLGGGIGVANVKSTERFTVKSNGFRNEVFPDRNETAFSIVGNIGFSHLLETWSIEWNIGLEKSINDGVDSLRVSVFAAY